MPRPSHPRFRVGRGALRGSTVQLEPEVTRHMRVLRLQAGDRVRLFDGHGREIEAELRSLDASGASAIRVQELAAAGESDLELVLVQAVPVKLPRMDTIVRQATELGLLRLVPVVAARSQVPGGGWAVIERRAERWERIAQTAAQQAGRSLVPFIESPVRWSELDWSNMPGLVVVLDPTAAPGSAHDLLTASVPPAVTLLAGPEGGWSTQEVEAACEHGAHRVSLGPRVLRADSAAVVAMSVLQHVWGDLARSASDTRRA